MPNETPTKGALAIGLLSFFPDIIRISVSEDLNFRQRFDLTTDATIKLDPSGVSFSRSKLFNAVRDLWGDKAPEIELTSGDGLSWHLAFGENKQGMVLVRNGVHVVLPDFTCLSPDSAKRLEWFDHAARDLGLNGTRINKWREILSTRPVDDEEVDQLLLEIRLTPPIVAHLIANELRRDTISMSSLVPSDIRYYERLVGELNGEVDLKSFVDAKAAPLIREAINHQPFEGLKRALLLSSHVLLAQCISLDGLPRDDVLRLYKWLERSGDRISQLGGIECGLAHLESFPELEASLTRMVQAFIADDPENEGGRLNLLSSLIAMVDGELVRIGVAKGRPPFWRRLAAIAHASVIEREIVATRVSFSDFNEWAVQGRGQFFYLQSFVDLRSEPRWLPDFVSPDQIKAECIGRISGAAQLSAAKIQTPELKAILLEQGSGSIKSHLHFPFAYLPGPLEGGFESLVEMPNEIETGLRKALEAEELTTKSFASLVNSAFIFRIGPQFAQLAAEALRRAKYQVRQMRAQNETFALLSGLATVAAVTRSGELAEEVRILARVLRRRPDVDIAPEDTFRIAMITAAAYSDKSKWCKFVGDWQIELAFEDMTRETAATLMRRLQILCQLEPQLWETCARAEAACSAFVASVAA